MKTDRQILGFWLWLLALPIFGALSVQRWWRENREARKVSRRGWV